MNTTAQLPRALTVELKLARPGLDIRAQFRVAPGTICALAGRSGAGKSTLLQGLAGLVPVLGGRIALGNAVLYDSAKKVNLPIHARRLGWLDAQAHLFPHLSVKGNLRFGESSRRHSASTAGQGDFGCYAHVVQWLDLGSILNKRPAQLQATQRFKVALGRALVAQPHALLLDDPLGQVPAADHDGLLDLLAEIPRRLRIPVVLVTPRMNEVIRLAHDIVILHEGRMAGSGPAPHILSDVSLSTFLEGQHAGSVLEGEVKRHDLQWLVSEVDVLGQRVTVPAMLHAVGNRVRLKVRARDLNLHREMPFDTTASNLLRGRISQVLLAGDHGTYGAVAVTLAPALEPTGEEKPQEAQLWVMLTRKSIQDQEWEPGQSCVVSFKAMATQVSAWR